MSEYFGKDVFKLDFGMMRLPKNADGSIDIPQTCEMVDRFIAAGGTYFDTAYVYDNGESEKATRKALVDRYPRESYTVCTKLNAWMQSHDEESAKQQFYTSLERLGVGYFDYYLLHDLQLGNWRKYGEYHLWDFVKEQKAKVQRRSNVVIDNNGVRKRAAHDLYPRNLYFHLHKTKVMISR